MFVKICGMTDAQAVEAALAAGADAVGFVFAPSVRRVTAEHAQTLAATARGRVRCVAVLLHPTQAELEHVLQVFDPDVVQLDHEDLAAPSLARALQNRVVWPVLRQGRDWPTSLPPRVLYEGAVSGSGRTADWALAHQLARRTELLLAGGLNPDNVSAAIRTVRPFGVDVSSGVESAPGVKCAARIQDFVRAARSAASE